LVSLADKIAATKIGWIEIRWPPASRRVQRIAHLSRDRHVTIEEGNRKVE
jgi:hypothetical protein